MSQPQPTATPELVERARAGDLDACGELVSATEALVRHAIRGVISDAALADDALQETYLRAFAALRSLRDTAAFPAWLRRVAVSTARNELRRRRGVVTDPMLLDALPARPATTGDDALHAALRRAIVALPARERRLCDRYYRGGWTSRRLADAAGVSEAAIRKRLQRLRALLEKEMEMTLDTHGGAPLSDRIVELLSRPLLVDLPENPVGAVWDRIVAQQPDFEIVALGEELTRADIVDLVGEDGAHQLPAAIHRIDADRILRWDLSVPMLIASCGAGSSSRRMAAGKVYRDDAEDHAHLQAFHQAEMLWTGDGISPWSAMELLTTLLDDLLPGMRLRVEESDYPLYADRGYEVSVDASGHWIPVAGWARYSDRIASKLGLSLPGDAALGLGLGLERIACLRYGIDDVRRVGTSRIDG